MVFLSPFERTILSLPDEGLGSIVDAAGFNSTIALMGTNSKIRRIFSPLLRSKYLGKTIRELDEGEGPWNMPCREVDIDTFVTESINFRYFDEKDDDDRATKHKAPKAQVSSNRIHCLKGTPTSPKFVSVHRQQVCLYEILPSRPQPVLLLSLTLTEPATESIVKPNEDVTMALLFRKSNSRPLPTRLLLFKPEGILDLRLSLGFFNIAELSTQSDCSLSPPESALESFNWLTPDSFLRRHNNSLRIFRIDVEKATYSSRKIVSRASLHFVHSCRISNSISMNVLNDSWKVLFTVDKCLARLAPSCREHVLSIFFIEERSIYSSVRYFFPGTIRSLKVRDQTVIVLVTIEEAQHKSLGDTLTQGTRCRLSSDPEREDKGIFYMMNFSDLNFHPFKVVGKFKKHFSSLTYSPLHTRTNWCYDNCWDFDRTRFIFSNEPYALVIEMLNYWSSCQKIISYNESSNGISLAGRRGLLSWNQRNEIIFYSWTSSSARSGS